MKIFMCQMFMLNKFSWVPHENILTRKFYQVEITVHVHIAVKRLLYTSFIFYPQCYRDN